MPRKKYSLCESVTATAISPWCIRPLTKKGRKPGGGVDMSSLCGRVRINAGWDVGGRTGLNDILGVKAVCKRCVAVVREKGLQLCQ